MSNLPGDYRSHGRSRWGVKVDVSGKNQAGIQGRARTADLKISVNSSPAFPVATERDISLVLTAVQVMVRGPHGRIPKARRSQCGLNGVACIDDRGETPPASSWQPVFVQFAQHHLDGHIRRYLQKVAAANNFRRQ